MQKTILIFFIFTFFLFSRSAFPQVIDSMYYGWVVYEYNEENSEIGKDDKRCYIVATPHKTNSSYTAARNPYISITRYEGSRSEEINVHAGYEYKISSDVYMLIGNQQKQLYTNEDSAWAKNDYEDKEIIQLMLSSDNIKIRSDSSTGNYAVDEYQTKGLVRAYARMKELCK